MPINSCENKKNSLVKRMKLSIIRFLYFCFSLFFIGLTAVILFLTLRMLRVWFST
jgi:cellulose synthase/poly-beta-1,6-N-acetylglucosamine synthase-like glycosyltransferase